MGSTLKKKPRLQKYFASLQISTVVVLIDHPTYILDQFFFCFPDLMVIRAPSQHVQVLHTGLQCILQYPFLFLPIPRYLYSSLLLMDRSAQFFEFSLRDQEEKSTWMLFTISLEYFDLLRVNIHPK